MIVSRGEGLGALLPLAGGPPWGAAAGGAAAGGLGVTAVPVVPWSAASRLGSRPYTLTPDREGALAEGATGRPSSAADRAASCVSRRYLLLLLLPPPPPPPPPLLLLRARCAHEGSRWPPGTGAALLPGSPCLPVAMFDAGLAPSVMQALRGGSPALCQLAGNHPLWPSFPWRRNARSRKGVCGAEQLGETCCSHLRLRRLLRPQDQHLEYQLSGHVLHTARHRAHRTRSLAHKWYYGAWKEVSRIAVNVWLAWCTFARLPLM